MRGEHREFLEDCLYELKQMYGALEEWSDYVYNMSRDIDHYLSVVSNLEEWIERLLSEAGD